MILFGRQIAGRLIGMIVGALLIIGLAAFGLYQCDQRRNEAAQGKVGSAQAGAAAESGNDAGETIAGAGRREAGSEELTRSNEREIRGAEGADSRIGPGVDAAGRAALCRREAYRNDPKCVALRKAGQ